MEKIVEQGLLFDFYGELLTEHQRRIYEDMVLNDLSPSEIAKEQGISRMACKIRPTRPFACSLHPVTSSITMFFSSMFVNSSIFIPSYS